MKVVVTGTRGIPGILGGVETHCEELFPHIAADGYEVIVVRRPHFKSSGANATSYMGVKIKDLKTFSSKHLEAFAHTLFAVIYAKSVGADIVHIHAVGPSLITPLVKLLGMKAVVTHHGPDYDRQKWGRMSKGILRLGERLGARYADRMIVISSHIEKMMFKKYPRMKSTSLIYNGVSMLPTVKTDVLERFSLESNRYVIAVGRFVKEKGFDYLIDAFVQSKSLGYKLVIAGDADHADSYSESLKILAKENGVVLTGFLKREQLSQLYSHAALFVLPSFHEGLPISLLEAMSCGCDVLVSDIPANLEVGLGEFCYFKCGDRFDLVKKLDAHLAIENKEIKYDMRKYNWDYIASQTKDVYASLLNKKI